MRLRTAAIGMTQRVFSYEEFCAVLSQGVFL